MVLYSESWRSRMRTGNKTIEKQTQYCKQSTPLFLNLIHLSDGAFETWVLEQNVITWFVENDNGSSSNDWNSGTGMNMAIHLLQHPTHFFWNDHYNTYTYRIHANHLCVFCPGQLSLAEAHRHVGGTHKCVVGWGVKVLRIKDSTQGQPFPLGQRQWHLSAYHTRWPLQLCDRTQVVITGSPESSASWKNIGCSAKSELLCETTQKFLM